MGTVKFKGTADYAQIKREHDKLHKQFVKLREEMRKTRQEGGRGNKEQSSGLSQVGGQIRGVVLQYVGMQAAIRGVTAAIEQKQQVEGRARDVAVTAADAQLKATRMLGDVTDKQRNEYIAGMKSLAVETKVALPQLYLASAKALSSSAGNVEASMQAVRAGALIAPEAPAEMEAVAMGVLHMGKATKSKDAMANLGFLLGVGQQAAVTDIGKIATNISRGVIGITGYGGTARESGAIMSGLTQAMPDPEGTSAATAGVTFAKEMQRLVGKGSPLENIRYLQQHPGEIAAYKEKATFGKGLARIAQLQMLGDPGTAGDTGRQFMETALEKIPTMKQAPAVARRTIKGLREPWEQRIAEAERAGKTWRERAVGTPTGKRAAGRGVLSWENLQKDLEATGASWFDVQHARLGWYTRRGEHAEAYRAELFQRKADIEFGGAAVDTELVKLLEERLREVTQSIKQQIEAANRQTQVIEKGNQRRVPAGAGMFTEPGAG